MENKINIAELLKDCPKGMELDCTSYDNVSFDKISDDKKAIYPIFCYITDREGNRSGISFTENGCESKRYGAKCVIFPKGKTTWEGFHRPFKDGYVERLATEEEKEKLFDAIKANGYKWNAETKTLEKLIKEENMKEKLEQITLDIPKGYEFFGINDDNQVVLTKNPPQYPKTYDECCKVISVPIRNSIGGHKWKILQEFQKLIVCRDAYWKIAGEQMGLEKPWEPNWLDTNTQKYCIYYVGDEIKKQPMLEVHHFLAFPTAEICDAFYENFKELINETKELL